jgi:hypothetical protein
MRAHCSWGMSDAGAVAIVSMPLRMSSVRMPSSSPSS